MKRIVVADIMTRDPITIKPDINLLDCAKKMVKKRVGSLLLVDNRNKNRLVGLLTSDDIMWALVKKSKKDLSKIRAIDISPRKLATVNPSANIEETIKKMKRLKFERLPVIKQGELVGIITVRDILNFKPEIYPELNEFAKIREESKKLRRVKKAKTRESIGLPEDVCERCGKRDILYRIDERLICESCRNSM